MEIITINCGMLDTNCYIIHDGSDAVVIDPADEAEKILSFLDGLHLRAVLLTHGHFDHIGAVDNICRKTGADLYINSEDEEMLEDPQKNASYLLPGFTVICNTTPRLFNGDTELYFANIHIKALHTPGHTKGSCCFICDDFIVSGDTLFRSGIGRTDLYGGSIEKEFESIRKLFSFENDYVIYPGHGPKTTLKREKRGLI